MRNLKKYLLNDLCLKVTSGGTPLSSKKEYYLNGSIPWLKTKEVANSRIYKTENHITELGLANSSAKLIPANSVIVAMYGDGETAGRVAINKIPVTTNQACCNLVIDSDKANFEYIYYYLLNSYEYLVNLKSGSGQQNLSSGLIKNIEIEIHESLTTQTRIASILSALDDKIELNRRMNHTLEQMAQTLFKKYFVDDIDPDNLPDGWRWGVLSDITNFINGYAFSSKELLDENNGNCYHVFKMGHIKKGGGLNTDSTKSYFDKSKSTNLNKYVLKKGDLLMCMTDMKDSMSLLGHTALMNEDDKYIVNQRVGLIRLKDNNAIGYGFLYILTNSIQFIEDLRSRANSGVQVNLSTDGIKNAEVIIPDNSTSEKFNKIVTPIFDKMFSLAKESEHLTKIRDSLLPKLMSGEIEVP